MTPSGRATDARPATIRPTTTSTSAIRDSGCQVGAGGASNETSISPERAAVSSRIVASRRRSRLTTWSRTGRGLGEGCEACSPASSSETATAWRYRSNRSCELARSAVSRSAWRAFSSIDRALGEAALDPRPALAGTRQRVAVALELSERRLPLVHGGAGRLDRLLGDLEPARVLRALRVQVEERLLEHASRARGAAVGAADRRLEAIASAASSRSRSAQLLVTDRCGRSEEGLARDAGELGERLIGERRVGDRLPVDLEADGAPRSAERLLEGPGPRRRSSSSISKSSSITGRASSGASHGRSASRSAPPLVTFRVRASSIARWIVVLPASFGPRTIVSPGDSGISSSR